MRRLTRGCVLLTFGLLVLTVADQARCGVKLRYGTQKGTSSTFQVVMDGETSVFVSEKSQKTNLRTEMFLTQKVVDSQGGLITLLTSIDSGSININGIQSPLPNIGQKVTSEMKENGEIVSTSGFNQIDTRNMQLVFPTEEIAIGSTWSNTVEPNLQVPVPLNVTYKVLSFEKIKNFDCVKIASTVRSGDKSTIEGLSLDVKADGFIYFAYKEGKMVRNEVKSSMRMILKRVINNEPQSIITKMTMNMRMEHQF
jgi:hypothetical protein